MDEKKLKELVGKIQKKQKEIIYYSVGEFAEFFRNLDEEEKAYYAIIAQLSHSNHSFKEEYALAKPSTLDLMALGIMVAEESK